MKNTKERENVTPTYDLYPSITIFSFQPVNVLKSDMQRLMLYTKSIVRIVRITLLKNTEKNTSVIGSESLLIFLQQRKKLNCVSKNCRVTKYAEEDVAYGINYFMKVSIGDGLFIHIRVHRQEHHNKYDFYSLHERIKHNQATCIFTEGI
jgi:hypothetical protein